MKQQCCKFIQKFIKRRQKNPCFENECQTHTILTNHFYKFRFPSHRSLKAVHFSDNLIPLPNGRFKLFNKPTYVTCEFLRQNRNLSHTHNNHLDLYYLKKNLQFVILTNLKMNKSLYTDDSNTSDKTQNTFYTS